jgi:hypothetical protein
MGILEPQNEGFRPYRGRYLVAQIKGVTKEGRNMHTRNAAVGCALAVVLLLVTGCDELIDEVSGVQGSGNLVSESREVSGFDEIAVLGSGDVIVDVDGTESLVVEAEDNILPLLRTEVRNSRLELGPRDPISPTEPITYTISAAALEGVLITGSGDIAASNVDADSFVAEITGSGHIEPTGTAAELDLTITGSGEFEGTGLVAATGSVSISGSGNAAVNVTDALDVSISGSGNVAYIGNPTLDTSISGSGNISQR